MCSLSKLSWKKCFGRRVTRAALHLHGRERYLQRSASILLRFDKDIERYLINLLANDKN